MSNQNNNAVEIDLDATLRLDLKCKTCDGKGHDDKFLKEYCRNHPGRMIADFTPIEIDADRLPCGCTWDHVFSENVCPECLGECGSVQTVTVRDLFAAMVRQQSNTTNSSTDPFADDEIETPAQIEAGLVAMYGEEAAV